VALNRARTFVRQAEALLKRCRAVTRPPAWFTLRLLGRRRYGPIPYLNREVCRRDVVVTSFVPMALTVCGSGRLLCLHHLGQAAFHRCA